MSTGRLEAPAEVGVAGARSSPDADARWLAVWAGRAERRWRRGEADAALRRLLPALGLAAVVAVWRGAPLVAVGVAVPLLAGAGSWWWARRRAPHAALARALEARLPASRNLLLTALELLARGARADAVYARARALVSPLDLGALFPVSAGRLAAVALLTAATVAGAARLAPAGRGPAAPAGRGGGDAAGPSGRATPLALDGLEATVRPPDYLGQPSRAARDPRRLEVPEGARITWRVRATGADSVVLEEAGRRVRLPAGPSASAGSAFGDAAVTDAAFTAGWRAERDVVLALEGYRGGESVSTLLGVRVVPDAAPRVRIVAPGRDLVLPRADTTLRLLIEAEDDHALGALRLRYTKVSGSGERYAFADGEVPLTLRRVSPARWEATVAWSLAPLALAAGDVVVYRAVAADRRPAAPLVESEAWLAELPAGRGDGAAGFAVDVGELRYALSQQMIVLRIERLIALRDSLRREATGREATGREATGRDPAAGERLVQQAANIAIEQRRVRAEFVFMMGGELGENVAGGDVLGDLDEHQHAEVEGDLSAGRVRNEGRVAVFAAIRAMSRTTTALADTLLPLALASAREAAAQLERAFSTARFLMRPLAEREAIDGARRLTGSLLGVTGSVAPPEGAVSDARRARWQAVLRALTEEEGEPAGAAAATRRAARWQAAAGTLARSTDAADQALALTLDEAAVALRRGATAAGLAARDRVALALAGRLAAAASTAPPGARSPRGAQLDAARPASPPPAGR
jgi:hypothetical protein